MPETIYLDSNATTKPAPEVVRAVGDALEVHWANPSSVHRPGQAARRVVELAREKLAGLLGVKAKEVVLTGSGTESIDLAIRGRLDASGRRVIVTDDAEHAAVRDLAEALERTGIEVRRLPLLAGGLVDHAALSDLLAPGDVAVVSVQWANNETGVIQPVERVHETCREHGVAFHCDATQWVGKMPIAGGPPCDLLTCSAHKLHGPKGVGALWIRRGTRLRPVLHGAQELGRRAGTENVPGIAGAGEAARLASEWLERPEQIESGRALRDRFESLVLAAAGDAVVNGREHARLWNTSNIGFPGLEAEALLLAMSERGLCASAGAACSSGSLEPSPVLLAMGVEPRVAHGSVRFSLSRETTAGEIETAAGIVGESVRAIARLA